MAAQAEKGTVKWFLSGGAGNTNPANSLGGVISSQEAPVTLLQNVLWQWALAGRTDYLCVYLKNTNLDATAIAANVQTWLASDASGDDAINIQWDPAGVGDGVTTGVATTIPNLTTAPSGVSFPNPAAIGSGNSLTEIALLDPGETAALWIERTIPANADSQVLDQWTLAWDWGR